ncbi:MAG: AraC family transcriptional regulator [Defluviitaleaceae bacterium]|nr:AraC family transcriptional regulator [Defluviitaleaceae bacterium]
MQKANKEAAAAVERMKAYIAAHLQDSITASDLARDVGYSQYHMARIFKGETGLSPFEYIRRQRLTAAAHVLRDGKQRIVDVALDFVFDSHEGFTKAFATGFGILPKKYASYPEPYGWLIPRRYLNRSKSKMAGRSAGAELFVHASGEVMYMEETAVIFTQIIERPARKLILKRSVKAEDYFTYCEEVGSGNNNNSAPWDILCDIKEALYEPVGLWLPENMHRQGTGIYAHGVEVSADYAGAVPENFDVINLEPCKLLIFQGEPYDDEHFMDAVGQCMNRIKKFNPEVYGYRYAPELAPRMQLAPMGWRGYIEMMPVCLL